MFYMSVFNFLITLFTPRYIFDYTDNYMLFSVSIRSPIFILIFSSFIKIVDKLIL